jgi:ribosomal protein S18 acetylase RimI-like enzyme
MASQKHDQGDDSMTERDERRMTTLRVGPSSPIVRQAWTVLTELRAGLKFDDFVELLADSAQPVNNYYATVSEGTCVAVVGWRIHTDARIGRHAYVADLVVSKSVRGSGIGRTVIEDVAKQAASVGCKTIVLDSGVTNTNAHRFYETIGFDRTAVQFSMPVPS